MHQILNSDFRSRFHLLMSSDIMCIVIILSFNYLNGNIKRASDEYLFLTEVATDAEHVDANECQIQQ